jgi:hypothetical protein
MADEHSAVSAVHDVRFHGAGRAGMAAECGPCRWRASLEGGHTAADLARAEVEHCGDSSGSRWPTLSQTG